MADLSENRPKVDTKPLCTRKKKAQAPGLRGWCLIARRKQLQGAWSYCRPVLRQ